MPEDSIHEQRKTRWMDTGVPGPNVVVPTSLLPQWSGSQPPKDGRTIEAQFRWKRLGDATDYDRACDVNSAAAIIPVGSGEAIVLYAEGAMPVAWMPLEAGGVLLAQVYTLEEPTLPERLPSMPSDLDWEMVGSFTTEGSPLRLMHATEAGDEEPVLETQDVPPYGW